MDEIRFRDHIRSPPLVLALADAEDMESNLLARRHLRLHPHCELPLLPRPSVSVFNIDVAYQLQAHIVSTLTPLVLWAS